MATAVFLDRDNTLIVNDGDLGDPNSVVLCDGVPEGLRALHEAGFRLIVVTNQAGVARGTFTEDDVDQVHQRIATLVDREANARDLINRFYYCPYHPEAVLGEYRRDHPWRKPHPGMLLQAARDMHIDLTRSWMIGNQKRDVTAGRSAGCRTVLLGNGRTADELKPTVRVKSFAEAVETILQETPPPRSGIPRPATESATALDPASSQEQLEGPKSRDNGTLRGAAATDDGSAEE
jgi:D,D-heptose 1,7-bisphosphate phosphatase